MHQLFQRVEKDIYPKALLPWHIRLLVSSLTPPPRRPRCYKRPHTSEWTIMYLLHRRYGSAQLPEQVTYSVLTNSPVSWLSFPRTAMVQAPSLPPRRYLESTT